MTNDRITELMNREIDGVLSEAESAELSAFIAEHPEARHSREELQRLSALLHQVQDVEPPADLSRSLMAALPIRDAAKPGLWASLGQTLASPRMLAYAGAAAAVLILAFFGRDFIKPVADVGGNDGVTGTLAPRTEATAPEFTEIILDRSGLSGSIRLSRAESGLVVQVDVASGTPLRLVLTYDEQLLSVAEVAPEVGLSVEAAPGRITLRGVGFENRSTTVSWAEKQRNVETTIQFEFFDSGTRLHEGSLTLLAR